MLTRCPECGSFRVRPSKFGMAGGHLREFGCLTCRIVEDRRSDAPDYVAWVDRWTPTFASVSVEANRLVPSQVTPDTLTELRQRIAARPHDDALRLAYATVIVGRQPERAEFIRLQIQRYYDEAWRGVPYGRPGHRESTLKARHALDWTRSIRPFARAYRSDAPFQGVEFERGFVADIRTEPEMWADMGDRLLQMAPIEHLTLTPDGPFIAALTSPNLARIRTLRLNQLGLGDDEAIALADHGHLDRCDALDLSGNRITTRGFKALLANPTIRSMPVVRLYSNPCDPHVWVAQDLDGGLVDWGLQGTGVEAEREYGRIDWLHIPPIGGDQPDDHHVATFFRDGLR